MGRPPWHLMKRKCIHDILKSDAYAAREKRMEERFYEKRQGKSNHKNMDSGYKGLPRGGVCHGIYGIFHESQGADRGMDRPALRRHVLQRAILYSSAGRSIRGDGLRNVEKQQRLRRKGSNDPIPSDHLKGRRSAQGPWRGCGENHSIDDPGCERSHRVYPAGLAKNHPGCHGFSGGSIGPLDKDPLVHCSHRRFPVPSSGRIYLWCQYENQYDPAFFAAAS